MIFTLDKVYGLCLCFMTNHKHFMLQSIILLTFFLFCFITILIYDLQKDEQFTRNIERCLEQIFLSFWPLWHWEKSLQQCWVCFWSCVWLEKQIIYLSYNLLLETLLWSRSSINAVMVFYFRPQFLVGGLLYVDIWDFLWQLLKQRRGICSCPVNYLPCASFMFGISMLFWGTLVGVIYLPR